MFRGTGISPGRIGQCLLAVTALALISANFENSPFREPVLRQLYALSYLSAAKMRVTTDAPPRPQNRKLADRGGELGAAAQADSSGGFYNQPLKVTLTHPDSAPIYYTLDGSPASVESRRYRGPIAIDRTTVLRFARLPGGREETHTYMIGEPPSLPVLSVSIDPVLMWNRHAGIYTNPLQRGRAWRRPVHAEYFADVASPAVRVPAELRIHGNWSRRAEKKSFKLSYATARVSGHDRTRVLRRADEDIAQRTLIIRAMAMDLSYRLGDELFREVFADNAGLIVPGRKIQLLLNGQPWGLYRLYENISKAWLQRVRGGGEYDLVDDAGFVDAAGDQPWNQLIEFFQHHDLNEAESFERARQLIDIENFTDYWLFNIYAGNLDWPQNNYFAFRHRSGDGRWRWISWDTDTAFDIKKALQHDTLAWATRGELRNDLSYGGTQTDDEGWMVSTAIVRGLLKNESYKMRFIRRFCELRNLTFRSDRLQARFQRLLDHLTPHLRVDWERWPDSKQAYQVGVEGVRRFIAERPSIVLEHFHKRFAFNDCPAI